MVYEWSLPGVVASVLPGPVRMKILVTGGTGVVGTAAVEGLGPRGHLLVGFPGRARVCR